MKFSALLIPRCPHRPHPATLGVALALVSASAMASAPLRAPDSKRVAQAVAAARSSTGAELVARTSMVNARGQTIVHATQQVQGHRVWGSAAVIHTERAGMSRIAASSIGAHPVPAGTATLTQARAVAIARKALGLKGASLKPKAELVVFPTKYHGDIKFAWNPDTKQYRLDRANSVVGVRPTDAYVWAWEVEIFARNRIDGIRDMKYLLDARTGALLRVDTGLQTLAPANPPIQLDTDVAAKGTGFSQYSGTVSLDTTAHADGSFALIDRTRGSQYNPWMHDYLWDGNGDTILDPNGNPVSVHGNMTIAETHEGYDWTFAAQYYWFDGTQFAMYPYGYETSVNGQTAAVDAHWGMGVTWDFYKNVLGRDGVDNAGTSLVSEVHILGPFGFYYDNAFWDTFTMGMFYSDGTRNAGVNIRDGSPTTPNPDGFDSLTAIDIIGHEMTHGVTAFTSGLVYSGESGGINEATSDFMGSMVEAYSTRPAGADSTVPETGTDWLMGAKVGAKALRSLKNPNSDGYSPNYWYSGIEYLDVHFSSGPMNRFFYLLSQGASSDTASDSYSKYLPGGMTGIGNDKATRIWYTAMTEWMTPVDKYADVRAAAVNAAIELYGDGSAEVIAVKSAFAAINVGSVDDTPRISIKFAVAQAEGSLFNQDGDSNISRMPIVAMNTTVQLSADVTGTDDTSVTWKLGGMPGDYNNPGFRVEGGKVGPDGTWSPDTQWGFHSMTVVSNADPLEFAEGAIWVIDGDADADNEFDAMDLGAVALSFGLNGWVNASHSIVYDTYVDSFDVEAISQAFKNAYGGI
ncbi:MAG: M4 family metallopeptidase [Betaproteobacteria bacterium]